MKQYDFDDANLPKVNPNEDLETISNNYFRPLFSVGKFEIRSESARDKGIDFHIELKKEQSTGDSVYTNFRFAVQLKATESIEVNTDGSFSIQIYSSNINYLLNNGMPAFYVFYHKPTHSFYYENVNNFVAELQKKDVDWSKQEKHSLRFSKLLDADAISAVYQETFDNGILLRQLNQHLKFSVTDNQSSGIIIDQKNEVYSVAENIDYLDKYGHELINGHHFNFIIEIEQRTHPRPDATPRFNLICGIAYFQRGNLYKAMELLKLAQKKAESFEPDVQAMLTYTLLNAKFLLGIMNKQDFNDEMSKITENQDSGSFFEIEKAYNELTSNKVKSAIGIKTFYQAIFDIVNKDEKNVSMRITAYAKILGAEAVILFNDLELNFTYFIGRLKEPLKSEAYLEFLELEKTYLKRLDALTKFALKNRYFLGVSNLVSDKVEWDYRKIFHKHLLSNWKKNTFELNTPLNENDIEILKQGCQKLDKIVGTYEMLEHRENLITCLNTKYEILDFLGQTDEAIVTKTKILTVIEDHDFVGLQARHNDMINGKTGHQKFINSYTAHINRIQEFATKNDIDVYSDLSDIYENIGRRPEWSIEDFFEFNFPD